KGDVQAAIDAWDGEAEDYVFTPNNNFVEDPFLRYAAEKVVLTRDMRTLDVGCGAGAFSVAMSTRVGQADGCDFSPRMIEVGTDYAREHGIDNLRLWVANWHECGIENLRGAYDLVFAHTTPAICDLETLEKMIACSKEHCFYSTCARRRDLVYDECLRIAGFEKSGYDDEIALVFNALWALGYSPELGYGTQVWESDRTVEAALRWNLGRMGFRKELDEETVSRVRDYVESVAVDGLVHEVIETTIVNFYWKV
ncbi:MAG: class I SAM-dependent methyltransferase, partial [Atopobiaceae bacterium]|nr:class I SAM-dependent methyltransferase [Atopobiaceae bacterium]